MRGYRAGVQGGVCLTRLAVVDTGAVIGERIYYKQATQKGVSMQEITTGHNSNDRAKCWHVYSSGVHVVMIALQTDVPHRADHPRDDAICARSPSPDAQGRRAAN